MTGKGAESAKELLAGLVELGTVFDVGFAGKQGGKPFQVAGVVSVRELNNEIV